MDMDKKRKLASTLVKSNVKIHNFLEKLRKAKMMDIRCQIGDNQLREDKLIRYCELDLTSLYNAHNTIDWVREEIKKEIK